MFIDNSYLLLKKKRSRSFHLFRSYDITDGYVKKNVDFLRHVLSIWKYNAYLIASVFLYVVYIISLVVHTKFCFLTV